MEIAGEPLDRLHLRFVHLSEEVAGVRRQRLNVPALSLGVDGVERERRLTRPGEPGDDGELFARDPDVEVLEVVLLGAADLDVVLAHLVRS